LNHFLTLMLSVMILLAPEASADRFVEAGDAVGFSFKHYNSASGEKYPIETMAGGCAFLDADGDGDLDIYVVNGALLPGSEAPPSAPVNRLFGNNGKDQGWTFSDVTEASGVGDGGYGMGCATGDYDNDGDTDLYVTNYGENTLYRNDGGVFQNVTEKAGVGDKGWGMSSSFLDIEGDGDLDLYVTNYVTFDLDHNRFCTLRNVGVRAYCHPDVYPGQADVLYRNNGDGTFTDITRDAGVYFPNGKGLGVVCGDFDLDGDTDIYVANDSMENYLFLNRGDGTFFEEGLISGAAFNEAGHSEAGMGVDSGDIDGDGLPDLLVGHLDAETNTYYRNLGDGLFQDLTAASGMAGPSLMQVTFGLALLDGDNDGDIDAFVANGHVLDNIDLASEAVPYRQHNQFFQNNGAGRMVDVSEAWGFRSVRPRASRGAAAGDFDNDGRIDLLVGAIGDSYELLRNRGEEADTRHWVLLELQGSAGTSSPGGSNRDALGARVTVIAGGVRQTREVHSGYSYLSAGDRRVHFGLGSSTTMETLEIRWPAGGVDVYENVSADRILVFEEGKQSYRERAQGP